MVLRSKLNQLKLDLMWLVTVSLDRTDRTISLSQKVLFVSTANAYFFQNNPNWYSLKIF